MRLVSFVLGVVALGAIHSPPAGADPLVVSTGSSIATTDTNSLSTLTPLVPVTGMQGGETLVGIDQRPATGELYGVGATGRLYRIDVATGAATSVGAAPFLTLNGTAYGTDFSPAADRVRLVSNTERNLRVNPDDGTLSGSDSLLNPAGNVVGSAYTDNVTGAAVTTLFGIDSAAGTLVRQGGVNGTPSPHLGALTTIGSLGLGTNLNEQIGFDIDPVGITFATITTAGTSRLYGINRATGTATNAGTIGTGSTSFLGLAMMSPRIRFTAADVATTEGGTAVVQVRRNAPAGGAVAVDYTSAGGTAASGSDFTAVTGTLSWGAGQSGTRTILVPIADDAAAEGAETFTVALSNPTGSGAVLGAPTTITGTIAANSAPPAAAPTPTPVPGGGTPPAPPRPAVVPPPPALRLTAGGALRQRLSTVRRKGVALTLTTSGRCRLSVSVKKGRARVGRLTRTLTSGRNRVRVRIAAKSRKRLRARQKLTVSARCGTATARRTVTLTRG